MSVMVEESASTPTRLFLVASSPMRLVVQIPMDSRPQIVTLDIGTAGTSSPDPFGGRHPLLVSDLGWSREEAAEVRAQFAAFEEDWDAPGMDAYDAL